MTFICGGYRLPEGIPDLSSDKDPCCGGRALDGPRGCECWAEVFSPLEQAPVLEGLPQIPVPCVMCSDCAYKADSPEKRGEPGYSGTPEDLERLAATGERFFCHRGIRYLIGYVHAPCERPGCAARQAGVVAGHCAGATFSPQKGDYRPPLRGGVPYQADGTPAYLCGGWMLRAAVLIRQSKRAGAAG